jgi:hypothetical protein
MNCDRGFLHSFRIWTVPGCLLRIRAELAIGAHLRAHTCNVREVVDRAVLSLKEAGSPFLFDRVKKLPASQ